jgi:diacylglycerol O-acyltransferase
MTAFELDHRMSDAEGLMWRLEKDPVLSSTYGNITILDRPLDFERFRRRMIRAVQAVPRLRARVQPSPVNLTPPAWVEDADFSIDRHLRHVALPAPGRPRQLYELATLAALDPFDRTRPLWEFTVVDGLSRGRSALIQKLHHTVSDGEGSVRLSLQFLDLQRDAPDPPPLPQDEISASPPPPPAKPFNDMVAGALRLPLGLMNQARDLLSDPSRIPSAGRAFADTARTLVTQLSDVEKARSPIWLGRSLGRRLEVLRIPLDHTKEAARVHGGTLNTAFLTAAAAAAGAYHRAEGHPIEELRASMAVSTRHANSGSNAFSIARMIVPTGEMDSAERFARINELAAKARATSTTASLEVLAALAATLPTSVVTRLARQQAETVDFATSNVRGAPVTCYIAGARVEHNIPIGPLLGVAFNLTLLSYKNSLDIGLNVDTAAVGDPRLLGRLVKDAFAAL